MRYLRAIALACLVFAAGVGAGEGVRVLSTKAVLPGEAWQANGDGFASYFSDSGQHFAVVRTGEAVQVYRTSDGGLVGTIPGSPSLEWEVNGMAFSRSGAFLAVARTDALVLYRLAPFALVTRIEGLEGGALQVSFLPDSSAFIVRAESGPFRRFNVATFTKDNALAVVGLTQDWTDENGDKRLDAGDTVKP